ncbi:hypothetical protein AB0933_13300 [Streptomyces venezuelae]|uniref:hypothetical protein n=1 Tax=Streptomyces venezuelae TaxID=54571 RepID=UPI003452371C
MRALYALARICLPACDEVTQLRCVARICERVTHYQSRLHDDRLAAVREAVITGRRTGRPQPALACPV